MTPEQFEHKAEECTKALEEFALFTKKDNRSKEALGHLNEILALARAAIPRGQVAEDAELVRAVMGVKEFRPMQPEADALTRLAAQAQSAHEWFGRWAQVEADVAKARAHVARLSAAGQVLSEHMDKAMPSMEGRAVLAERRADRAERALRLAGFEDHGGEDWAPPVGDHRHQVQEWTMRDEFAKAAMQALYTSPARQYLEDDTAQRAYRMADAMLKTREAKT
jgi:hypothetical protein